MSRAVFALILLQLDAHQGEWVSVQNIAGRLHLGVDLVQRHCAELVEANQVHHAVHEGVQLYGVGVEGVAP